MGGGYADTASGLHSTVGGGNGNKAGQDYATVGGGGLNTASGTSSTVSGGASNTAGSSAATVGGGSGNTASAVHATIAGGSNNSTSGDYSAIPGGRNAALTSTADYSFAFGRGVSLFSSYRAVFFDGTYSGGLGVNRDDFNGGLVGPFQVGTNSSNGYGAYLSNGGAWTNGSSRSFKENFQPLGGSELLATIATIPVESWNYLDSEERHVGPMAEDFVAAFDVGIIRESDGQRDNQYLAASDVAGVALAGVKELLTRMEQQSAKIEQLEIEIAELKAGN